ncbi:MAG: hypothetical protein CMLOHMNK_02051 [Steroidobacteraceae bacterium]|nr:hypothetical protein [Steroidobacteraceae bacterium]
MGRLRKGQRIWVKPEQLEDMAAKRNLSIAELARRCGSSGRYFDKLLQHQVTPGEVLRNRIMEQLGLTPGNPDHFDALFFIERISQEQISPVANIAP